MLNDQNRWRVRLKVWLEIDGHPVIGDGRMAMLDAIAQHGSIIGAARQLGISYRRIRGAIADMEHHVGASLVVTHRGGGQGGGARLTPSACHLVENYLKVIDDVSQQVQSSLDSLAPGRVDPENTQSKKLSATGSFCQSVAMGGKFA